ncbi:hypothetical protein GCM10017581_038470 [Dactylosporangium matsuzakiense]|uniref:Uncharacterized protein n=1 Tax=Dactylosporangium matsuzakiense TaxID=53360 RepID=A0A9W6KL08_9ACTN|nr:hypothetical protein GCM10017581_038470 [Dactylosporangium matsuzakiense]
MQERLPSLQPDVLNPEPPGQASESDTGLTGIREVLGTQQGRRVTAGATLEITAVHRIDFEIFTVNDSIIVRYHDTSHYRLQVTGNGTMRGVRVAFQPFLTRRVTADGQPMRP